MINRFVIVGGGTSGWLTARSLFREMNTANIYLIDKAVGDSVGVGEATLLGFDEFMSGYCEFEEKEWKKELVKSNNEALYNGSMDDNSISADIVDQASSYTDKNVEMKAINRQIKLISEIDKALARIREDTYGYCLDTAEPIGLKRLMARPVAKYTIAAQEKHEKDEKVHADD